MAYDIIKEAEEIVAYRKESLTRQLRETWKWKRALIIEILEFQAKQAKEG